MTITPEAVEAAVKLSDRYINDRNLPDKAIDLIDEAAAALRLQGLKIPENCIRLQEQIDELNVQIERSLKFDDLVEAHKERMEQEKLIKKHTQAMQRYEKKMAAKNNLVTEDEIAAVVAQWTKIPLKKLEEKESERLLKLEKILHKRVIGQSEAVEAVAVQCAVAESVCRTRRDRLVPSCFWDLPVSVRQSFPKHLQRQCSVRKMI